jgi:hypothetical protein
MKATIGGIFSGTFEFLRANWLIMIGMFVVACVLLGLLGYLMIGSFISQAMTGGQPDPSAILAMMGQLFLFYLIMLVVMNAVSLSVWRHGMTNGQDPVTSNIGWALLGGVTLTLFYFGLIIALYIALTIVMLILFAIVGGGVSMMDPGGFSPENLAGPVVAVIVLLYLAIRADGQSVHRAHGIMAADPAFAMDDCRIPVPRHDRRHRIVLRRWPRLRCDGRAVADFPALHSAAAVLVVRPAGHSRAGRNHLFSRGVRISGRRRLAAAHSQVASGGRLIRIASTLPPVLSPNRVPRS